MEPQNTLTKTQHTPKKIDRFEDEREKPLDHPVAHYVALASQHQAPAFSSTLTSSPNNVTTSPEGPTSNVSPTDSQPPNYGRAPSSNLSSLDVKKWTETGTFGATNTTPMANLTSNTTTTSSSIPTVSGSGAKKQRKAFEESPTGVKVIQVDEGEKDKDGNVMEAVHEPCEQCGGKVVWATKGEWLMICEECQEPQ